MLRRAWPRPIAYGECALTRVLCSLTGEFRRGYGLPLIGPRVVPRSSRPVSQSAVIPTAVLPGGVAGGNCRALREG